MPINPTSINATPTTQSHSHSSHANTVSSTSTLAINTSPNSSPLKAPTTQNTPISFGRNKTNTPHTLLFDSQSLRKPSLTENSVQQEETKTHSRETSIKAKNTLGASPDPSSLPQKAKNHPKTSSHRNYRSDQKTTTPFVAKNDCNEKIDHSTTDSASTTDTASFESDIPLIDSYTLSAQQSTSNLAGSFLPTDPRTSTRSLVHSTTSNSVKVHPDTHQTQSTLHRHSTKSDINLALVYPPSKPTCNLLISHTATDDTDQFFRDLITYKAPGARQTLRNIAMVDQGFSTAKKYQTIASRVNLQLLEKNQLIQGGYPLSLQRILLARKAIQPSENLKLFYQEKPNIDTEKIQTLQKILTKDSQARPLLQFITNRMLCTLDSISQMLMNKEDLKKISAYLRINNLFIKIRDEVDSNRFT